MHKGLVWRDFVRNYLSRKDGAQLEWPLVTAEIVEAVQQDYRELKAALENATWEKDNYRIELLGAAQSLCLMAELSAKLAQLKVERLVDIESWAATYEENWRRTNKESELAELTGFMRRCEAM